MKPSLSIFFPCYNDAGTIGSLVTAAELVASEYTEDYEIIVVDDGSTDSSRSLLQELTRKFPRLRLIFHERNFGYGAALRSGFTHAKKDFIFYTDGDGQYDVFDLRHFLKIIGEGVDVVNGYKIYRNDPLHRRWIGRFYVVLMRALFRFRLRDVDCDFRLIRKTALDQITLRHDSGVICLELVNKLELGGFRIVEYPLPHYHRTYGRSQFFRLDRLFQTGVNIVRLWWQIMIQKDTPKRSNSFPETGRAQKNPSLVNP